jgi:hypothetical protein
MLQDLEGKLQALPEGELHEALGAEGHTVL